MEAEDIVKFISIFLIVWWLIFQATLSFGLKIPDKLEKGHASSAPENPRIKLKIIISTVISLILTYLIILGIKNDILF